MEGTSGAADPGLLRGRTGDAALAPRVSAQATHRERQPSVRRQACVRRQTCKCQVRNRELPPAASRKRVVRGSVSSYPSRGPGLARWDRNGQRSLGSVDWQCRPLQPAVSRSHDERCPSGSGWGSALAPGRRKAAWSREKPAARAARPLARETSAGDRLRLEARGFGLVSPGVGGATRARCRVRRLAGFGRACRRGPSAARWRMGFGLFVAEPTPESGVNGARERTLAPLFCTRGGDRAIPWSCSRVGLVAEVDERRLVPVRENRGSSPLAFEPAPCAWARAQRVKGRRKPGRGGESHEHASSDTGGGFLVIPHARRASAGRARGREHSSMEGVPARRRLSSLTRRRQSRAWRPEAKGIRLGRGSWGSPPWPPAVMDPPRVVTGGRQRSGRKPGERSKTPPPGGEARRSRRSGLRQDHASPHT